MQVRVKVKGNNDSNNKSFYHNNLILINLEIKKKKSYIIPSVTISFI